MYAWVWLRIFVCVCVSLCLRNEKKWGIMKTFSWLEMNIFTESVSIEENKKNKKKTKEDRRDNWKQSRSYWNKRKECVGNQHNYRCNGLYWLIINFLLPFHWVSVNYTSHFSFRIDLIYRDRFLLIKMTIFCIKIRSIDIIG